MKPISLLLAPPRRLASCVAAAIVRDTRGASLCSRDRLNFFPATPLVSVTKIIEGELRVINSTDDLGMIKEAEFLPDFSVVVPQNKPTISWSPNDVYAVTVGFYPDAWVKLGGDFGPRPGGELVESAMSLFGVGHEAEESWDAFCSQIGPEWDRRRHAAGLVDWPGSDLLSDWTYHMASRIAQSATGRSMRTLERRLRQWTNKSRQELDHYAAIEELHRLLVAEPDASLSALAVDADFSDQSHMGRSVKRVTGFSPAKLNKMIREEEAFWCYRLLGERF